MKSYTRILAEHLVDDVFTPVSPAAREAMVVMFQRSLDKFKQGELAQALEASERVAK